MQFDKTCELWLPAFETHNCYFLSLLIVLSSPSLQLLVLLSLFFTMLYPLVSLMEFPHVRHRRGKTSKITSRSPEFQRLRITEEFICAAFSKNCKYLCWNYLHKTYTFHKYRSNQLIHSAPLPMKYFSASSWYYRKNHFPSLEKSLATPLRARFPFQTLNESALISNFTRISDVNFFLLPDIFPTLSQMKNKLYHEASVSYTYTIRTFSPFSLTTFCIKSTSYND